MPIDPKLLEIIRCPVTKVSLYIAKQDMIDKVNAEIEAGNIRYADGNVVDKILEEGLVTNTGTTLYRIDSDIPIMLEEKSIPMSQLE